MNGIPGHIDLILLIFFFFMFVFWVSPEELGLKENKEEKRIKHLIYVFFLLTLINPYPTVILLSVSLPCLLLIGISYKIYQSIKETWFDEEEIL